MKIHIPIRPVALALLALAAVPSQQTFAQPAAAAGSLDPTIAGSGESCVGFGGGEQECCASTVQADGNMVLAVRSITGGGFSEFELMRFGTNNALDPASGAGGAVFAGFSLMSALGADNRHIPTVDEGGVANRRRRIWRSNNSAKRWRN